MAVINATRFRENMFKYMTEVNESNEPLTIVNSKGNNTVLISEDDWHAIEETLYLHNVPGLVESIKQASAEPIEECIPYNEDEEW